MSHKSELCNYCIIFIAPVNQKCSYFHKSKDCRIVSRQTYYFLWKDKTRDCCFQDEHKRDLPEVLMLCQKPSDRILSLYTDTSMAHCTSFDTQICIYEKDSIRPVSISTPKPHDILWEWVNTSFLYAGKELCHLKSFLLCLEKPTFLVFSLPITISMCMIAKLHILQFMVSRRNKWTSHLASNVIPWIHPWWAQAFVQRGTK